tara:strand:- start:135 stop:788 length:654 start_codon:yes stop_codon:yes gene_type:complete
MIPVREKKEFMLFNRIPILVQDNPNYSMPTLIDKIQKSIPQQLTSGLDYILISKLNYMKDKEVESIYKDGIIYMSPEMEDTDDAILSVVHEIAHLIEEEHPNIYMDESIEAEFVGKRNKLEQILIAHKIDTQGVDFQKTEYCEKFDDFLYLQVGYPVLRGLTSGLFLSPYAATSVREYFADAFEEYFLKESKYIKLISPSVYFKIEELLETLGEEFT